MTSKNGITSKGGSTFLFVRPRILLYVTHDMWNRWTAYRQTWLLPWKSCSVTQRRNQPVTGDFRFTVEDTAFKSGRTFLSVSVRTSLYFSDNITNCSRRQTWMLPARHWYVPYRPWDAIQLKGTSDSLKVPWTWKCSCTFPPLTARISR